MLRILLDAHFSARRLAVPLRARGHEVRAISDEPQLKGLPDLAVLELASSERRILVTADVTDFPPLLRDWAEGGRSHSGCVLVHGIDHAEFGLILRGLYRLFKRRPEPVNWEDLCMFLTRREG